MAAIEQTKGPKFPEADALESRARAARALAREAGAFVAQRQGTSALREKDVGDFVTEVDIAAEELLRRRLQQAFAADGILGEELPPERLDADFVWVLDPIDGTSNFGRGLPVFAVSVACLWRGSPAVAAVHCQPQDVTYAAWRAGGAWLCGGLWSDRRRVTIDAADDVGLDAKSILGVQWHRGARELTYLNELVATGTRVRNYGSTVTQLCDVATGRFDGNVQEQGKLWDFAAAALVVTEAGGRFTGWDGEPIFPVGEFDARHYPSIAARPGAHAQLCRILGPHRDSATVPLG